MAVSCDGLYDIQEAINLIANLNFATPLSLLELLSYVVQDVLLPL